jgi:hypothetical protein
VVSRIAALRKKLLSFASKGDGLLLGCFGLSALEALDLKIKDMDERTPLAAAFLDPFVKPQLAEIAKIIPSWNMEQVEIMMFLSQFTHLLIYLKARRAVERFAQNYVQTDTTAGNREADFEIEMGNQLETEMKGYSSLPSVNMDVLEFWATNSKVKFSCFGNNSIH